MLNKRGVNLMFPVGRLFIEAEMEEKERKKKKKYEKQSMITEIRACARELVELLRNCSDTEITVDGMSEEDMRLLISSARRKSYVLQHLLDDYEKWERDNGKW